MSVTLKMNSKIGYLLLNAHFKKQKKKQQQKFEHLHTVEFIYREHPWDTQKSVHF